MSLVRCPPHRHGGLSAIAAVLMVVSCSTTNRFSSGAEADPDRALRDSVVQRLQEDPVTEAIPVSIEARSGMVTVRGRIDEAAIRGRVLGTVKATQGVASVIDRTAP
jgi:osmotically-inducible protein OsmY